MAGVITIALIWLLALPGTAFAAEQRLLAADGAENDRLGDAVAIDGDTIAVGAFNEDGAQGAVYVFRRFVNRWVQTAKLTASDGAANDRLGVSVAIHNDVIVAGADGDDANRGSAYTFARTGAANRTETAKLTASDGLAGDQLGVSVAIDGETIVAGARFDDVGSNGDQGSAYTFARTGAATRTETAKLTASDGMPSDFLGRSVAIDGDTIVAGASNDDVANANEGSAYTFATTGAAARTQTAKLTAADNTGFADDSLGTSVAIEGDTIVAGAPFDDLGANAGQGSVLTFDRTGAASRNQTARLSASDGAPSDNLGFSVTIDSTGIVAGARNAGSSNEGAAYRYTRAGAASRTETGRLTAAAVAANDTLGSAVAIDAGTLVAGAPSDNIGAETAQGSASVFFTAVAEGSDSAPAQTTSAIDRLAPSVSRARLSRKRFRVGRGTMISFRLSEAARISVRVDRRLRKRSGRRRYRRVGTFSRRSRAGANRIRFSGRISRRKLRPGNYRLTLTPTDAAGNRGKPRRLGFRILR